MCRRNFYSALRIDSGIKDHLNLLLLHIALSDGKTKWEPSLIIFFKACLLHSLGADTEGLKQL